MFSEDKSFNRTILSIENHLSPKAHEFLDEAFEGENFNDVNLEDLLNVSSVVDNLGLLSADTSLVQEENNKPQISKPENEAMIKKQSNSKDSCINKASGQRRPLIS